jgi:glycosyltransferase involved in cell wall biosynthesis
MPAILYDGPSPAREGSVGIDVAMENFLAAFVRHGGEERIYCVTPAGHAFSAFRDRVEAAGGDGARCVQLDATDAAGLERAGLLFRYDPSIIRASWIRREHGQRRYSLCGLTHTSSTEAVMDLAGQFLTAPAQKWDGLICPSNAIKSAILSVIEGWRAYLEERLGVSQDCPMNFPVIPLGVDGDHFAKISGEANRQVQRSLLGLEEDAVAILFVGRLSHYTKTNPVQLLLAMEEAAGRAGKPVYMIFMGYFPDGESEEAFRGAAETLTDKCRVRFVEDGDANFPDGLWAAADIFCSLSDNIEESFGLTPIEAKASGLPVVVSDWDGYRDTVRGGTDGFLVPTLMPGPGAGADLAYRYFTGIDGYGEYLASAAQATSVDGTALTAALGRLIEDGDLRRTMGEAGRKHVQEELDWRHVIASYKELWADLAQRREREVERAAAGEGQTLHPLRPDPFQMFEGFASRRLDPAGRVELVIRDWPLTLERIGLKAGLYNPDGLIEFEDLPLLIGFLEERPDARLGELLVALNGLPRGRLLRTIGWLIKLGICVYREAE